MTDAELEELHPPIRCGDGSRCDGATLRARICEVGLGQSGYGAFKPSARFECEACDWRRDEPLKDAPCAAAA